MRSSRIVSAIAALLLSVPGNAAAQAQGGRPDSTVVRLPGIQVQAIVPLTTIGGTSAIEVTVDSLRLSPAARLEDVLRAVPLLHVRTNSRGEAEVLARGSESRQVAVLVDGVPLTLGWDARTDVSVIPAGATQSLRVLRGLSSVLHGPNVLGGVIELQVAGEHATPDRAAFFDSGLDAHGGGGAAAGVTLPWEMSGGHLLVRGGGGYRASPGVPLAAGVAEPVPGADGLRLNTDSRSGDAFLAARYRSDAGPWASLSASAFRAERGIPAELAMAAPRLWRYPRVDRTVTAFSGGTGFHDTPFGRGDLEFSLGHDQGRTEIVEYASRAYDTETGFEMGDALTRTLRLLGDHTLGGRGDLRAAFTWADILHDEAVPAGENRYRQRLWSIGAETDWRVAERAGPLRAINFSFGGARDGASTLAAGDKPPLPTRADWGARAGLSAVSATGNTQYHAGISRRARFPALRETYSGALNRFDPNPGLMPERLTAFEGGVTTNIGAGHVQAVLFHHRLDDAIVRITLPDRRFRRVNENQQRSTGVELLASQSIGAVRLGGDVTWQRVELITPALRRGHLENQPRLVAGFDAAVPLPFALRAHADARYTGRQYCLAPTGEDIELTAGTRFGAVLSRLFTLPARAPGTLLSRLEASAAVDNATDAAMFDQCGLPQPGRRLSVRMRVF